MILWKSKSDPACLTHSSYWASSFRVSQIFSPISGALIYGAMRFRDVCLKEFIVFAIIILPRQLRFPLASPLSFKTACFTMGYIMIENNSSWHNFSYLYKLGEQ